MISHLILYSLLYSLLYTTEAVLLTFNYQESTRNTSALLAADLLQNETFRRKFRSGQFLRVGKAFLRLTC